MSRTYSMILLVKDENRRLAVTLAGTTGSVDALHGRNHFDEEEKIGREVYEKRCIGEELMKTSQPTSPRVIWKTRPISPRYRMTKDVPRPLFPRRQLSHAIVLYIENFPKPLFSFRIAVLFLSFLPMTVIYRLPKPTKHKQTWSVRWSVRKG